jgi:hypothetical protein
VSPSIFLISTKPLLEIILYTLGWVDVKWAAMDDASRSTLTNATEQVVHALNNTATQFASHPSAVATSGLPVAAMFGFVPGLMVGSHFGISP